MDRKVTLIPGDGIGPEIMGAVKSVFRALEAPIEWEEENAGITAMEEKGELLPQSLLDSIERNRIALKGPITTPVGEGFRSINIQLRQHFDLYANIRPSKNTEAITTRFEGVDLVIISAGTGHNNDDLHRELDVDTVTVNVLGFMAVAQVAMEHFLKRGRGHLVGISSIAALRGNRAATYAASKAFQSVYLDGLRDLARHSGHPIVVTEVQPGGVDTAMLKPDRPLPPVVRWLFVASPAKAARQILRAIQKQKKHAYITRRYAVVAFILRLLPRPG